MAESTPSILDHLDQTTLVSLGAVVAILSSSYALSLGVLPKSTPKAYRVLFIWHFFDFLIHSIFEGSFLYNCFFARAPYNPAIHPAALLTNFLNDSANVYGSRYADNWASGLWMVYAKADKRWAEADLTVISLELLTVFGAGPLALSICYGIAGKKTWVPFWMTVLATGEIYGGFMTFAPEWLTGNQNLDGSNFMFLWVYLVFFNMIWVFLPGYALYVAFGEIRDAFKVRDGVAAARKEINRRRAELKDE